MRGIGQRDEVPVRCVGRDTSVTNDEELARALLTGKFPDLGEVRTVLLKPHSGPAILHWPLPSPASAPSR